MKKNHIILGTTMRKYILALIASLMATTLSAQTLTPQQEQEFYQKVYALFGEYALSASVSDDDEEYEYRKLFINGNLLICNDLMSLSHDEKLSVDDYISILKEAKSVKVKVRNIKKDGSVEDKGETWMLPVVFEKSISYSKCGTLFSSYDYFGEFYHLRAEVSLNKYTGECYISALEANPNSKSLVFPESFTVLERTNIDDNRRDYQRDAKLTINGHEVQWNKFGQVILHPTDIIRYNKAIVDRDTITEGKCGGTKIHANYNDKAFRIRPNVGFSLSGFNKLCDAPTAIETPKNNEMSFGLDFGYVLPSTSKLYVGFFTGINMSSNTLTMEMSKQEQSDITDIKDCTADEDGDSYTRHYKMMGGVSQELKSSNITIPLYADFEYQMIPILSAYADLGVKLQMTSGKWSANCDGYETFGSSWKNTGYSDVVIKGDVNLNGFGEWKGPKEMDVDDEGMSKSMSINVMVGAGLRLNLTKSIAFDAGIQYVAGGNSWKMTSKNSIFTYALPGGATTPEEKAKGDKVNLLRQTSGIKQGALRLAASIIYKF